MSFDYLNDVEFGAPTYSFSDGTDPMDYINRGRWEEILAGPYIHTHAYTEVESDLSLAQDQASWVVRPQRVESVINLYWGSSTFTGANSPESASCDLGTYAPAAVIKAPIEYEKIDANPRTQHIGYVTYADQALTIYSDAANGEFASYGVDGQYKIKPGRTSWFYYNPA